MKTQKSLKQTFFELIFYEFKLKKIHWFFTFVIFLKKVESKKIIIYFSNMPEYK